MDEKVVLFVDDEIDVLHSLKRQFRKEQFESIIAIGGEAALELLEEQTVQVVISDERMPGMSGIEFLQKVKKEWPDTVRIVLSGYADTGSIIRAINKGEIYRFISKPWSKENMVKSIQQAFSLYDTVLKNRTYMKKIIIENKKLHKELKSRNSALDLSFEVLNRLPVSIMAVTDDNRLELLNEKTSFLFGEDITAGISIGELFGETLSAQVIQGFEIPGGQSSLESKINGKRVSILTRSLRPDDPYRGLIIIETNNKEHV